jgi:hypothetical protein
MSIETFSKGGSVYTLHLPSTSPEPIGPESQETLVTVKPENFCPYPNTESGQTCSLEPTGGLALFGAVVIAFSAAVAGSWLNRNPSYKAANRK